jgi:uncharacterized protein YlbG (UPF0298 family)
MGTRILLKISLIVALIQLSSLYAQGISEIATPIDAFKDGEWFEYRVRYGVFNASYISLKLNETQWNDKAVFHAQGYGKSTGLLRLFFKVEDYYESYFDVENGLPYRFIRNIHEGGYTKDIEMQFDHQKHKVQYIDKKKDTIKNFAFQPGAQDMISAFYYLRRFFPKTLLPEGEGYELDLFFDQADYRFRLVYLGKEYISTKFGKIRCLKFTPSVQSGRVFKDTESVTIWVTDDLNRIPVRIEAGLAVGTLYIDLERFRNLNNPFEIQVK